MLFKPRGKVLFYFSLVILLLALLPVGHRLISLQNEVMNCSTKAIMHFENPVTESVNANVHFNFGKNGKGSIMVEGYSDSTAGWLYLQRYVEFTYTSKRISPTERYYQVKQWDASKSSIDQSPDVIFDYFMREMSDSHDGLLISAEALNAKTVLLSSIQSPLFVCNLKSDSTI